MAQNDLTAARTALAGVPNPMTPPTRFLMRMLIFMVPVAAVTVILIEPLIKIFSANPALNGLIIAVLFIGIGISVRQVLSLRPEVSWLQTFRPAEAGLAMTNPPRLLAPMAAMLSDRKGRVSLSATSMRTLLDGIETRLVEGREISRYMIGLLIFLGLLGTFWGLLETVSSVGQTIKSLSMSSDDFSDLFNQLQAGLEAPLNGMGLAFSSSLLGLAGSLVLGFLDLQAGQAQNRFYNDLEEWLSGFTKLSTGSGIGFDGDAGGSVPAYVSALLEQTAESLDKLQRTMAREEASRRSMDQAFTRLTDQLSTLGDHMRTDQSVLQQLADNQAELRPALHSICELAARGQDPVVSAHLRNIDSYISRMTDDMERNRDMVIQEIRSEIKLLARTIANVADSRR